MDERMIESLVRRALNSILKNKNFMIDVSNIVHDIGINYPAEIDCGDVTNDTCAIDCGTYTDDVDISCGGYY